MNEWATKTENRSKIYKAEPLCPIGILIPCVLFVIKIKKNSIDCDGCVNVDDKTTNEHRWWQIPMNAGKRITQQWFWYVYYILRHLPIDVSYQSVFNNKINNKQLCVALVSFISYTTIAKCWISIPRQSKRTEIDILRN